MDLNFLLYVFSIFFTLTATAMVRKGEYEGDTVIYDYIEPKYDEDSEMHDHEGGSGEKHFTMTEPGHSAADASADIHRPSTSALRGGSSGNYPSTASAPGDSYDKEMVPTTKPDPAERPFVDTRGDEITITRPEGLSDESWHTLKNTLCHLIQRESLARRTFLANMLNACPTAKGLAYSLGGYDEPIAVVGDDMHVLQFRKPEGMKEDTWNNIKYYAKPIFHDAVLDALPGLSWHL